MNRHASWVHRFLESIAVWTLESVGVSKSNDELRVGSIYEDCSYHPCLCTAVDISEDEVRGISLIDGSGPRSCSIKYCGPVPLNLEKALEAKRDFPAYLQQRMVADGANSSDLEREVARARRRVDRWQRALLEN
jgi:hypothetical protein